MVQVMFQATRTGERRRKTSYKTGGRKRKTCWEVNQVTKEEEENNSSKFFFTHFTIGIIGHWGSLG